MKNKNKDTKGGRPVKSDWTKYEHHFWDLCQEKNWKPTLEEDNTPVLLPGRTSDCYRIYAQGPGRYGVLIMATHAKTMKTIIKKLGDANIMQSEKDILVKGDTEAIVLFNEDRLPRAVKTLNLRKKRKGGFVMPREQLLKNLEKANKAKEKK